MANKELFDQGEHMMTVCNSCRYCEGFCAVWRAMEYRRAFPSGDLAYLSNLCHDCSECYYACQYAPPHEWAINPPLTFSKLRDQSYEKYAWPKSLASAFRANGLIAGLTAALAFTAFLFFVVQTHGSKVLSMAVAGGDFYKITSHDFLITTFGAVALFIILVLLIGVVRFSRDIGEKIFDLLRPSTLKLAGKEALRLEYLDCGGWGCAYPGEESRQVRRWFHHITFYGFMLCFSATTTGAIYDFVFHWPAPYAYTSLPVILGVLGGIGLLIGPLGLLVLKQSRNREITYDKQIGNDIAFLVLLFLSGASGLALLVMRQSYWMSTLLIIHLGLVMAFFLTMPYGKFVHGLYRFIALAKYALERKKKQTLGV